MNTSASFSTSKLIITIVTVAVVIGSGAFYGGMKYAESNPSASSGRERFSQADFQNLSLEERQKRFQELGANVGGVFSQDHDGGNDFRGRSGSGQGGFRPLSGEILSQTKDSITIKLADGSTKLVFVSDSIQITKSVDGTLGDLTAGEQVFIAGDENPDGSYTAKIIQLSPVVR